MPIIGEVQRGKEIGKVNGIFCWLPCDICKKSRWAETYSGIPRRTKCHSCSVKESNRLRPRFPPYIHGDSPQLGDIAKGKVVGHTNTTSRYIYSACIDCGKQRWVVLRKDKPLKARCHKCAVNTLANKSLLSTLIRARNRLGENSNSWRGGIRKDKNGYIEIWVHPNDCYAPMASKHHYCYEHRLVIAKHLGRCLLPWEVVHHINGNKHDNRLENLELLPHGKFHVVDMKVKARLIIMAKQIILLENILRSHNIPLPINHNTKIPKGRVE